MELIASYVVGSGGENADTLETPTFTPDIGETIVVKCGNQDDDDPTLTGVFGGGLNWLRKTAVQLGTGNVSDGWLYVGEVVIPQTMAVSTTWSAAEAPGHHGMIVERWTGVTVANLPATNSVKTGSGTPSSPLTATQYGSAITWLDVDWNAAVGNPVPRGVDGEIVREYSPGGQYLAPFTSGRTTGATPADATTHTIIVPATRRAGDVVVVFFSSDAATTASLSAASIADGWQVLGTLPSGTSARQTVVWKIASGVDPLTMITASAEQATWVAVSVTNGATIEGGQAAGAAGSGGSTVPVTPVVRSTSSAAAAGATSYTVVKPPGLGVGDYLLAVQSADADTTTLGQSAGLSSLATSTGSGGTNLPPVTLWGKVATTTEVNASTFTFSQAGNTSGGGVVILIAIQAGTYTGAPTFGSWTTQTRGNPGSGVATMTASGVTGVANGLLMSAFCADSNGNAQTFPAGDASGQTLVAQQQSTDRYALAGVYREALTGAGATGTESVTPSGTNTSNGWATVSLMFGPGSTSGGGGSGGGTVTTPTTATVTGRTTGINETAATSHTVALPTGVQAGEAALVLFNNDTATATASTTSSGWVALDTQAQGTSTNHRGTVFYAANAATAATLVVAVSASVTASWSAFRVSGAASGNPSVASSNGSSASSFTAPSLSGLASDNYTALLLLGVDSSADTSQTQAAGYPAGWGNTQTRRPTSAGTLTAPDTFTAEQRYTTVTAITPGTVTLSISEQWVAFLVAFRDGSVTTTLPGAYSGTPPPVTAAGGDLPRLWLTGLTLDTSAYAASAQDLSAPGGFGTITRQNGAGTATTLTATAEATSTSATISPSPWGWTNDEDFITSTVAITGGSGGGGGVMRMYAGINYDPVLPQPPGPRTIGMSAPTGQAWTLIGIELLPAPVSVLLEVIDDTEEPQPLTGGRSFGLGAVDDLEELPDLAVTKLVAGPLLAPVDELVELPDLTVFKQLPPLGVVIEHEVLTPDPVNALAPSPTLAPSPALAPSAGVVPPTLLVTHLVELPAAIDEVEELPDAFGGGTGLGVITEVADVLPFGVGFGGIDIAQSWPRRGLAPTLLRGGVRAMAQDIISGRWVSRELPVSGLELTRTLSGAQVITGRFDTEITDLRDVHLEPWGTWIHIEEAGEIRGSGILLPGSYAEDGALELVAHGVSAYVGRVPYTGEARFIQADPAEIVRTLWQHVQSFPRGDLGVTVVGSTPVRVGTAETEEVTDDTVAEKQAAAKAIIDALANPTVTVGADWTWPGAPDVVTKWNTWLIGQFNAQHAGGSTTSTTPVADGNITRATYKEMAAEVGGSIAWAAGSGASGAGYDWTQNYGAITAQNSRGYVGGLCGFSTANGSMLAVVKSYTAAVPGNALAGYVDELTTLANEGPGGNADARAAALLGTAFQTAWAAAAATSEMRMVQRQERDRQFFNPALQLAQTDRLRPLGLVVLYAATLTFGLAGVNAARAAAGGSPAAGGEESAYLRDVLGRATVPTIPTPVVAGSTTNASTDSGGVDTGDDGRLHWIVGARKIEYARRDVAHAVLTAADDRGFYDIIGADTDDDDDTFPLGADVTYRVRLTPAEADRFRRASNCRYVEPDTEGHDAAVGIPDPATLTFMRADIPEAASTYHGRDVIIGLLDGGTTTAVRNLLGVTMLGKQTFGPDDPGGDEITSTHGCLVAPCLLPQGGRFLDAVVSSNAGVRTTSAAVAAARWCADQGATVLNYSGAGAGDSSAWNDLFTYLAARGVQFFASMGNDGLAQAYYPAAYSTKYANCHSSISVDKATGQRSSFSNHTATASGCAPGTSELGLTPAAATTTWSGTSASCPHMARLCAMGATGGRFTAAQVGAALKANTRDLGLAAADQGGGAYDLTAALGALGAFTLGSLTALIDTGNLGLAAPVSWTSRSYTFSLSAPPVDREATGGGTGGAASTDPAVVTAWLNDNIMTLNGVVTEAGKPWELHGYELPMIGKVIDQLGEETPFEFVEEQGWVDDDRNAVWHRIRLASPRVGSRLDLTLVQGENVLEHAPFEEPDDAYADSAYVQGKGEGQDAVSGFAGVDVPTRLRLPKVITDRTLGSQAAATARAHEEVAAGLAAVEEIAEIAVNVRHESSLWGSFDVGDEVLPHVRLPWLGEFAQWHRIVQLTYSPDRGVATAKLSRRDAFRSR